MHTPCMFTALLHVLAALSIVYFARVVFTGRGKDPRELLSAALGVLLLTLFTGWPVHAAAGMLLGLLFPLAVSRRTSPFPMLWVLACAAAFAVFGAGWVIFPLAVAVGLWLMMGNGIPALGQLFGRGAFEPTQATPDALTEQAGGLPMTDFQQAEPVPVASRAKAPQAAPAQVNSAQADPLGELHFESRLPAEARAQLVALDGVTAEALAALGQQGQDRGEAAYQLRAIRGEYAPNVVQAYLRLPPTLADVTPLEGHKTGRDLLTEQLELLIGAAKDILSHSALASSQELLSNGRFLRDKFGPKNRDLEV